jgi:hypothetical protein
LKNKKYFFVKSCFFLTQVDKLLNTPRMWRSNEVMYVTVPYNKVLFSILYFLTSQSEFDFGIPYV